MRLLKCFLFISLVFVLSPANETCAQNPLPDDTLTITATIPYNGQYGTGEAYVYLSDTHAVLTNPVIAVEGFDLDNNMNWDELYTFLNQADLVETIRSIGFDVVVLNFTDATDYLQKNAFVLVELMQQIHSVITPETNYAIAGASMGGLCSRYALAYMEANGIGHRARTFISFDTPHGGANIPLGIQYWLSFFSELSDDAAHNLARLDRPAALQMLVYHHTDPPGSTGEEDSLRGDFLDDLAALGGWPAQPRLVAVANGSGYGLNQGYAAGEQIIEYEHYSFLVDIIGNIWSVPDGASQTIFDGLINIILLPQEIMTVTASGTKPYDNAPGGYRTTMAQMDSLTAPYGDIVALHPNHCFVPIVSALAIDTGDLFYDVAGDGASLLDHTPFEAVYYPLENQEHGTITGQSAQWFVDQVRWGATAVKHDPHMSPLASLRQNVPNPFNPVTTIRFVLPDDRPVRLSIYDASGRLVATLADGPAGAGATEIVWDGTNAAGARVASGVYFCQLVAGNEVSAIKMVCVE